MKLAEALIERAALVTKFQELKERILRNAVVQEGEKPSEDPKELLDEAQRVLFNLAMLVASINETNMATSVNTAGSPSSMTATLANRDSMRMYHNLLRETVEAATGERGFRLSRTEIKQLPALDVSAVQKEADEVAKKLRDLEVVIQQANWETDLV